MADSIYKYFSAMHDKRIGAAMAKVFERFMPRSTEPAASGVYLDIGAVTATAAELNRATDISARVVTTTATALSLTITQHAERVVLVNTNSTVANTFTLPVATGSGAKFTVINNIQQTQGTVVVAANGTLDTFTGVALIGDTTAETAGAFLTTATSDKLSMNRTTTGGLGGDQVELIDGAANVWTVRATLTGSGTLATPFSAS